MSFLWLDILGEFIAVCRFAYLVHRYDFHADLLSCHLVKQQTRNSPNDIKHPATCRDYIRIHLPAQLDQVSVRKRMAQSLRLSLLCNYQPRTPNENYFSRSSLTIEVVLLAHRRDVSQR